MKRSEITVEARKCKGSAWVHQGRIPEIGIDCLGVIILIATAFNYAQGQDVPDYRGNPEADATEDSSKLLTGLRGAFQEIKLSEVGEGDIVVFKMPGDDDIPRHVGVVTRGKRELGLVHSLLNKKTVEEPYKKWKIYATHAFRFYGLEDAD